MKNIKRKAFTLSELLIALGVVGILTAIMMPIIFNLLPDQNAIMAKRAFYTTETIVSDLINDSDCYPSQNARAGFDDGLGYNRCKKWGSGKNDIKEKFITLFADKLDVKSQNGDTITTKDGMTWTFSHFDFQNNVPDSYIYLTVDTNGSNEPNCGQSTASGACKNLNRKNGFDKFTMRIFARGRIQIVDCWAIMAAKTDKKLVGKEDAINCETTDNGTGKDECETAPINADDYCCNDSRWANSTTCNPCVIAPTDPDDFCCKEDSGSSWINSEACDKCTYIAKPTGPEDECCQPGHKWNGTEACSDCAEPYSVACCMTKKADIDYGDKCCEHNEIKSIVSACNKQPVIVTPQFYVSSDKPRDADSWGDVKLSAKVSINTTLPFNITLTFMRGCPDSGSGCGTFSQGMTCTIAAGAKSCESTEMFIVNEYTYKFALDSSFNSKKSNCGFTGFKPVYSIPTGKESGYSIIFKFPSYVDQYD